MNTCLSSTHLLSIQLIFSSICVMIVALRLLFLRQSGGGQDGGSAWPQRLPAGCDRPAQLGRHLPHLHTDTTAR